MIPQASECRVNKLAMVTLAEMTLDKIQNLEGRLLWPELCYHVVFFKVVLVCFILTDFG